MARLIQSNQEQSLAHSHDQATSEQGKHTRIWVLYYFYSEKKHNFSLQRAYEIVECIDNGNKRIAQLQKDGVLESFDFKSDDVCESCLLGKMTKSPFTRTYERGEGLLDLVHTDVCGPFRSATKDEKRYYVSKRSKEPTGRAERDRSFNRPKYIKECDKLQRPSFMDLNRLLVAGIYASMRKSHSLDFLEAKMSHVYISKSVGVGDSLPVLVYGGEKELRVTGYCDASWQTDKDDSKSQSGWVFLIECGAVVGHGLNFQSKWTLVADSTCESEYYLQLVRLQRKLSG
ncbi:hypothetical protein Tco_0564629 [Tanacetum coccineum]